MVKKQIGKKSISKANKKLWYGVFKGQRVYYYLHLRAHSADQARLLFCKEIARRQGVDDWMVLQFFKPEKNNFTITEVEDERQNENPSA